MDYGNAHAALTCPADTEPWLLQPKRLLAADELWSPAGASNRNNPVSSQAAVHTDMILPS